MRLGIAQLMVEDSVSRNVERAVSAITRLAEAGAQLVALPEMFCCPYHNESFRQHAQPKGGEVFRAMQDAARRCGVFLVAGSMPEADGGRIYNTSFVFDPSGALIARHRKVHLFDVDIAGGQRFRESDTLAPGNDVTVFETPWGKVGLCICFDIRFPELARCMALRGAQLLLVPAAFNRTTGPLHWELLFRARAADNQCFTVGVAPAQNPAASYVSYAHSIAVSPWGEVLHCMGTAEAETVLDLDFSEISRVRAQLPLLSARREDVYTGGGVCGA